MSNRAIILFAHGARDPDWASPLLRVRAAILVRNPGMHVELAYLEIMQPRLRDCAASLISEGFERIAILPMFIAQGGHIKKDIPRILDELRQAYPQVIFDLSGPVGETELVVQAMATQAMALVGNGPD